MLHMAHLLILKMTKLLLRMEKKFKDGGLKMLVELPKR